MYKIKMLSSVSDEMKKKMIEMDNAAFPPEDWGTIEEAELIYSIKNDSIILLLKDDTPIGFLTIFAVNSTYIEDAIKADSAFYQTLTPEILADENVDSIYCYCFLLLPEHRNKGLIYAIYKGMKEWFMQRSNFRYPLYAEAVSDDGLSCLSRLGFETIHTYDEKGKLQKVEYNDALACIDNLVKDIDWVNQIPVEVE